MSLPKLMNMAEACRVTTLSRTMINKHRNAGKFPEAVSIGEKRIAFVESEVQAWIKARMDRREGKS